ncbi:MAG: ABC transporter ATP-binding protein [Ilumatobacteraceae bacterium]
MSRSSDSNVRSDADRSPDDLPRAIPALWRTFRLGYQAEPRLLLASLATTLLMMLPDALLALWLKFLADGVLDADRTKVLVAALGLAVSATATWYVGILNDRVQRRFRDRISIAMEAHIARLQASVPTIEHQERPDYLDRLAVLRDQSFALDHLFSSLLANIGLAVRLAVTAVLLASIQPLLALLLLAGLPAITISLWRPGVERSVQEAMASHDRLARHLFTLATTAAPAKEVRILGIQEQLRSRRRAARARWYRPVAMARWSSGVWQTAAWALFGLAYVAGIAWVADGLDRSVGDVVLVLVAGQRLSQYLAQSIGELGFLRGIWLDASLRLTWLEDYAAARSADGTAAPPDRLTDGIRFEHVSFRYPGTERLALDDVDVHLPAATVVAIVGENGAGKTTLVKLLAGMYRPTAGHITIDGIDLTTIEIDAWRPRLAGAFQDFFRFELAARHSVGVGDSERRDDRVAVGTAIDRAGADDVVGRLPSGLDTQLGPTWDEGVEVSFGQWQKLALARGFMRDEPLVLILDEPTAALDAETEHALFERYAGAARGGADDGRVTILVSHRFSTVRMADLIVVLDGARVVEVGGHDELVAKGGSYAEMFALQATAYQ